jgi:hypothetical protein
MLMDKNNITLYLRKKLKKRYELKMSMTLFRAL